MSQDALKKLAEANAGRTYEVINAFAPELIGHLRVGDPNAIQKAFMVRVNDIKDQMSRNRDHNVHLELVGRINQLNEIIATFHYVRM